MKRNPFLSIGAILYKPVKKYLKREKLKGNLRRLHVVSEQELDSLCDQYYIAMITRLITVAAVCLLLSAVVWIKNSMEDTSVFLKRENYGGDTNEMKLETKIEGEVTSFSVDVLPVVYRKQELEAVFQKGFSYIDSVYLGENASADEICSDLNLIDEIQELGLQVTWKSNRYERINGNGEITEEILPAPEVVILTATLHYGDDTAQREYPVRLTGKRLSPSESAISEIRQYIRNLQEAMPGEKNIEVPDMIYGYQIRMPEETNPGKLLLILGLFAAAMILLKGQSDLKEHMKLRNDALLMAYPSFIERLALYMGAGLTIRHALTKIVSTDAAPGRQKYRNILYDEIKYTLNEIQAGLPESDAYYKLGHRLNLSVYLKVTSLLSQNLKKGTKDILGMLAEEKHAAFQIRKETAKKKGEEAGTRLLLPMMLLLGTVIVIIVLPAFMQF